MDLKAISNLKWNYRIPQSGYKKFKGISFLKLKVISVVVTPFWFRWLVCEQRSKKKLKDTRRLKTELKNVKRKLTDLKLRHGFGSTQQAKFRKSPSRLGKSSSWNSHRPKDLGLNTPIPSRNALGRLSNLFLQVFAGHKTIALVLQILDPLYHHVAPT